VFTGIIEDIGRLTNLQHKHKEMRLRIATQLTDGLKPGDSVAVDGVCLTVAAMAEGEVILDISHETIAASTVGKRRVNDLVHLERALTLGGRLGGHLVTGHVDGVGEVLSRNPQENGLDLWLRAPESVWPFLVPKGSVALDGVSLTVNEPSAERFRVSIVPYTLEKTKLGELRPGDPVNLESDILGKYVKHFVGGSAGSRINEEFLRRHGFL
jgi:riboflavin synthase